MPLSLEEALSRAQTFPERFAGFTKTVQFFNDVVSWVLRISSILLSIFLIHQLFFWLSADPEKAFDYATLLIDVTEISWDLTGIMWNTVADVGNGALIPIWNAVSFYAIEPAVILASLPKALHSHRRAPPTL